jgi:hypothetical protein
MVFRSTIRRATTDSATPLTTAVVMAYVFAADTGQDEGNSCFNNGLRNAH